MPISCTASIFISLQQISESLIMEDKGQEDSSLKNEYYQTLLERYEDMLVSQSAGFFEEEEYEDLLDYFESRNEYEKALEACDFAIGQYAFNAWFLLRKAQFLLEINQHQKAFHLLKKAEILDSNEIEIYLVKAEILTDIEQYDLALKTLKKALQLTDDREERVLIYGSMSDVYDACEDFDNSLRCLKKALTIDPLNEENLYKIWFLVDLGGHHQESVVLHESLINNDPYNYLAWYNLGHAYFGLNQFKKAADAFEYVILINEDFEMAYRDWAESLSKQKKFEEAIEVLKQALDTFEPYEEWYFNLGQLYSKTGNESKARRYFRKALQLDPYYGEAYYTIGLSYRNESKPVEAGSAFKKAVSLNEHNYNYLMAYAANLAESGELIQSIEYFKTAVTINPANEHSWKELAVAHHKMGNDEMALQVLDDSLQHCSQQPGLLYTYAAFFGKAGKKTEAREILIKAMDLDYLNRNIFFETFPELKEDAFFESIIAAYKPKL